MPHFAFSAATVPWRRLVREADGMQGRVAAHERDHRAQVLLDHALRVLVMDAVLEEPARAAGQVRPLLQRPLGEIVRTQQQADLHILLHAKHRRPDE